MSAWRFFAESPISINQRWSRWRKPFLKKSVHLFSLSRKAQAPAGLAHLLEIVKVLEHFKFEELKGSTLDAKRAGWSLWADHSLELADEPDRDQGRARISGGMHHGS